MPELKHIVLISDDVRFLEAMEHALRAAYWPGSNISRAHPQGDPLSLKILLSVDAPRTLVVVDRRHAKRPELWKLIRKCTSEGGHAIALSDTPKSSKDLIPLPESGIDTLLHNLSWTSERVARAVVQAYNEKSFAGFDLHEEPLAKSEAVITSPDEKARFLAAMLAALEQVHVQRTKIGRISTVVDELLMNALYNAPVAGPAENKATPREPPKGGTVHARWSLTNRGFTLSVRDPYGSLTTQVVQQRLVTFLTQQTVEVTRTAGRGGGVGMYMVLRNVDAYHVCVIPGEMTEVSIRLDLPAPGVRPRETETKIKSKRGREVIVFFAQAAS